ncbi:MAG: glycoside hydrolase [Halieaceae bacterium]|nr:glycoside hydrolase [Halieaceae bacterium]MCP5204930.1 glycoside hydrolase [Pseudomonadales bacterium]
MPADAPMNVVLCWHMHQPDYRDLRTGKIHLPWVYLHATKDYVDMAAHLEAEPAARAVVNFAPILLEQIEDYVAQIQGYLQGHGVIKDPLLAELAEPALPGNTQERLRLMQDCLRANRERMIDRFEPYQRLATMARWYEAHPDSMIYASNQFLADLLTWYHLSWIGESVQRSDPRIRALRDKAVNFSLHDRRELLKIILEQIESVIPRYRKLADNGQVELSMSPYAHPIVPLMLEFNSAREALPDVHLPVSCDYPGGRARAEWHLARGLETFQRVFGRRPAGLWPSEGGISQDALELFAEQGFSWVASGGKVLHNSHDASSRSCSHRVYRFGEVKLDCFFRDDGLSDLIGFDYSDWHANDAVANLVGHMENIARVCPDRDDCLITIILDGENAWEYYPENGYYFLNQLYHSLAQHPHLRMSTFEQFLAEKSPQRAHEAKIVAGSWVYGTFSTWIGDADKNRGWDILVEAKRTFDEQLATGSLSAEEEQAAERQLAICEGSDWFWWFGDYNPSQTVNQFDQLYRTHMANLYQLLNVEAPAYLSEIISRGGGDPSRGGVMRQHSETG